MILGVPVVDGHGLTSTLLDSLAETVTGNNFQVVLIDNGSAHRYQSEPLAQKKYPFPVRLIHNRKNRGYYTPLIQLFNKNPKQELIGLIHNDMLLYEKGWNERMEAAFAADPMLGLVGLCGSGELDDRGGRGGGTMCYFSGRSVKVNGQDIQAQSQDAGLRVTGLYPAVVLDSLFMMFRREVIPQLVLESEDWGDLTLAHFYDRIWPCRTIEAGYRVAVMGVECDHLGGMTTTGNERYRNDCIRWLDEHGIAWRIGDDNTPGIIAAEIKDPRNIPCGNPETEMYLVAERRFLSEYRDQKKFLPCVIGPDYGIRYHAR